MSIDIENGSSEWWAIHTALHVRRSELHATLDMMRAHYADAGTLREEASAIVLAAYVSQIKAVESALEKWNAGPYKVIVDR